MTEPVVDAPSAEPSAFLGSTLDAVLDESGAHDLRLIEGRIPDKAAEIQLSRLIGPSGGSIHLLGHTLTVPAGAVDGLTLFTMTAVMDGHVEVDLTAVSGVLGSVTTFEPALTLTLSYAWANDVGDPSTLTIVHIDEDTHEILEVMPSTVDTQAKRVTAEIPHFSGFAMAGN